MEEIFEVIFDNYQGEHFSEFYHEKKNAMKRFRSLMNENRKQEEFEKYSDDEGSNILSSFSYFDPQYNEFSTHIALRYIHLSDIFFD